MEGLIIEIGAKVDNAVRNIATLKEKLKDFKVAQEYATTPEQFSHLNNKIKETQGEIGRLTGASKGAGVSFNGLYGAIRQAANILPGLGISGIFLLAFEAISQAAEAMDLFSLKTSNAEKAQQDFHKELSKTEGKALEEVANVSATVKAIEDETISRTNRTKALDDLQKKYPAYFASQGIDINNTAALQKATDLLSAALIRKAKADAYGALISKTQQDILEKQNAKVSDSIGVWEFLKGAVMSAGDMFSMAGNIVVAASDKQSKSLSDSKEQLVVYQKGLDDIVDDQIKFGDNLKKNTSHVKGISDAMEELRKSLTRIATEETFNSITPKEADTQRLSAYGTALSQLFERGAKSSNHNVKDVLEGMRQLRAIDFKKVGTSNSLFAKEPGDKNTPIAGALKDSSGTFILNQINALQDEGLKKLHKFREGVLQIGQTLTGVFENVFTDIVQGGGNALKIFGKFIQQVIVKLIAAAAVAAILAAVTGGFSASASGGGFKAIFGQLAGIPKFASGGIVSKPTLAMVGEGGESEAILPLSKLNALMQNVKGSGNDLVLEQRVSGDEFVTLIRRTENRQGRSFGRG